MLTSITGSRSVNTEGGVLHPKARPFGMVDGYSNFLFRSEVAEE